MELDTLELQAWEEGQRRKEVDRGFPPEARRRPPRLEAVRDYRRRGRGGHWYAHECAQVRRMTRRNFRHKLRREVWNEAYYRVRNRDYRTYGWLTW